MSLSVRVDLLNYEISELDREIKLLSDHIETHSESLTLHKHIYLFRKGYLSVFCVGTVLSVITLLSVCVSQC
jgi:hypothetical protein